MMSPIHYEIVSENGLSRDVYRYWFNDRESQLALDYYQHETRLTKRHKWLVRAEWDRGNPRRYSYDENRVDRDAIPHLDIVRAEVLRKFVESITID